MHISSPIQLPVVWFQIEVHPTNVNKTNRQKNKQTKDTNRQKEQMKEKERKNVTHKKKLI